MKIKFRLKGNQITPKQFLAPEFYINSNEEPIALRGSGYSYFEISDLSQINLFVGANNSGKSRFLRGIFNASFLDYQTYINNSIDSQVDVLNDHEIFRYTGKVNNDYIESPKIQKELNKFLEKLKLKGNSESISVYDHLANLDNFSKTYSELYNYSNNIFGRPISMKLSGLVADFTKKINALEKSFEFWAKNGSGYKCYIPLYRSLLESEILRKPIYQNIITKYFDVTHPEPNSEVFTGLNLYDKVDDTYRSPRKSDLTKFNNFLSQNFFQKKSIDLIPDKNSKLLRISIDNGEYRSINEIGDGVQALILIMYPIFTREPNNWFFIEEPETNLHPGFQRIFIETLLNDEFLKTKNHRYFFTTHSNHFLDLTILSDEIAIIQFEEEEKNKHRIRTNVKPNSDVLNLLGVNTSSVFLANTSLWVEGPTDRKYLSKFLKSYCEHYEKQFLKEDIDFAFFEYAGSLIAHYLFEDNEFEDNPVMVRKKINAFALSKKIYLLADSDNADKRKAKGRRRIELEKLSSVSENFEFQTTQVREIENLLPKTTIKGYMKKLVKKEAQDKLKNIDFEQSDYEKTGIAKFYMERLNDAKIPIRNQNKFKVSGKSETLTTTYKTGLCDFFITSDIKYEDIIENNPILERIIKGLYEFITG